MNTKSLSTSVYWLSTVLMVGVPITLMATTLMFIFNGEDVLGSFSRHNIVDTPPAWAMTGVLALIILKSAIYFGLFREMRRLFSLFIKSQALSASSAQSLHRIGLYLLAMTIFGMLSYSALSLLLSSGNPVGQRTLSVELTANNIELLVAAGLMILMGRAMTEAARSAEENKAFI